MSVRWVIRGTLGWVIGFCLAGFAWAEEKPTPAPKSPLLSEQLRTSKKKGKRREQKETEGSEAPGRFEADTILKSPYTRDGQPLEVDPD